MEEKYRNVDGPDEGYMQWVHDTYLGDENRFDYGIPTYEITPLSQPYRNSSNYGDPYMQWVQDTYLGNKNKFYYGISTPAYGESENRQKHKSGYSSYGGWDTPTPSSYWNESYQRRNDWYSDPTYLSITGGMSGLF